MSRYTEALPVSYIDKLVATANKNSSSIESEISSIMNFSPDELLKSVVDFNPNLTFFHPDKTNYEPIINKYESIVNELSSKALDVQVNIQEYIKKIKRCEDFIKTKYKSYFLTNHRYKHPNINGYYNTYTLMNCYNFLTNLFTGSLLPEVCDIQWPYYIGTRQMYVTTLDARGTKKNFYELNVAKVVARYYGNPIGYQYEFPKIFNYWDIFQEGVDEIVHKDQKRPRETCQELKSKIGSRYIVSTHKFMSSGYNGVFNRAILSMQQWLSQFGLPQRTYSMYDGSSFSLRYTAYLWPSSDKYFATYATKASNAILDILKKYITKYSNLIEQESAKIKFYTDALKEAQDNLAYYSTRSLFITNFNSNINKPEFVDFPSLKDLEEIANEQNIPMSVAFLVFNNKHNYQNVNFAYPKFVVDLAITLALKEKRVNFNKLADAEKKYYLVTATKHICDNIYGNDELLKLIEYRMNLIDKYYDTFTKIDGDIVKTKANRIIKTVEANKPVTDETIGRGMEWKGFGKDQEDNTMGFFKIGGIDLRVTIPDIKLDLPKITIPTISIPKINITLPNTFNPVEGVLSLVGAGDQAKSMMNKAITTVMNTPIYVPVVSEAVGVAETTVRTVGEVGQAVINAGGEFIESTGEFIANSPQMVADIVHELGVVSGALLKAPFGLVDGIAYALLPKDIAEKLDKITDVGEKTVEGKLTVEDIKEAGQATMKLGIAPLAFAGKISADIIDTAKKNVPLIADLDKYSGGLLTSGSNLARASHVEYEGKGHKPELLLDAMKIGLVVLTAGTVSAMVSNVATTTATNVVVDKTGVGGKELQTAIKAYQSGDITGAIVDYGTDKAVTEGAKEVSKATGIPLQDVVAVGQGIQQGKPISQALTDAGKAKAKREINAEIKKKTGLPVTIDDIMNTDPSNKKSLVQEIQVYAKNPERLKELVKKETELAMAKEREKMEEKIEQVKKLKDAVQNFDSEKELAILQENANKEIDKRVEDMKRLDKEIADYSSEDAQADMEHLARVEKDKFTKKAYEDFYALKDKYVPQALLDYLMYTYGPKPNYDQYMTGDFDWGSFELPQDGTLFKKNPHKPKFTGLKIAGLALGAYASYKIYEA